jgi:hypothetical protein
MLLKFGFYKDKNGGCGYGFATGIAASTIYFLYLLSPKKENFSSKC